MMCKYVYCTSFLHLCNLQNVLCSFESVRARVANFRLKCLPDPNPNLNPSQLMHFANCADSQIVCNICISVIVKHMVTDLSIRYVVKF